MCACTLKRTNLRTFIEKEILEPIDPRNVLFLFQKTWKYPWQEDPAKILHVLLESATLTFFSAALDDPFIGCKSSFLTLLFDKKDYDM